MTEHPRRQRLAAWGANGYAFARRRPWTTAAIGAGVGLLLLIASLVWALPLGRALEPLPSPTLVLVTADGKAFARRGSYKEAPVVASELPRHVSGAFVAIEDRRFYRHWGVDARAIARAVRNNSRRGAVREGGSTITQQLAKNAFLTNRRTLRRKAQEAVIALYLEARLSKDEILSRYLSSVYFGDGVFGLRAAARHYFDKAPEKLSIGEAAMLAGVVKAPSKLAPTDDLKAARRRARTVLAAMVDTGVITGQQARKVRNVKVREGRRSLPVGSYFADWVSPQARRAFERAYGEVEVRTTLDSRLQRQAEQVVRRTMAGRGAQAALVAMRTDGSVVAMVGGRDYAKSQFNRAAEAMRQPGSAFKLFVYYAALKQGASPRTLVLDQPVRIGNWTPQNYEGDYLRREITYRQAFARSSNAAAVRVAQKVGLRRVEAAARELGITSPLPREATMVLGSGTVSLVELTRAYAAVAAGRTPVEAHGLAAFTAPKATPLGKRERDGLMELMRAAVSGGTGRAASLPFPVYGKTGTSQDYQDAWFVGFAGDLVVGVWVGKDDNSPMNGVTGGSLPARMWRDFVGQAAAGGFVRGVAAAPPEEEAVTPGDFTPEEDLTVQGPPVLEIPVPPEEIELPPLPEEAPEPPEEDLP
jgi:1A family penicillin-binding protein